MQHIKNNIQQCKQLLSFDNNDLLESITKIPSMLTPGEKKTLYTLAKNFFSNEGIIFDAGLYLGASTMCFAKGLQHNQNIDLNSLNCKPIQGFEQGICAEYVSKKLNSLYSDLLLTKAGDNFLPLLRRNIRDISDLVDLYEGDIVVNIDKLNLSKVDYRYEIVFLDVLKNANINDHVVKNVFPYLIPGKTILIQQDFVHEWLPFIHVTMGYLKNYFELICFCGGSAVFLNTKAIPEEMLNHQFYQDFTPEQMLKFFSLATEYKFTNWQTHKIDLAHSTLIAQKIGRKEALEFLKNCKENYEKTDGMKEFVHFMDKHINQIKLN